MEVWYLAAYKKKPLDLQSLLPTFSSLVCGLKLSCLRIEKFVQMERIGAFFVKKTKCGLE